MLSEVKLQLDGIASRQKALFEEFDPKRGSKLLDFYVRTAPRLVNAERCSIFINDPDNRKVWVKTGTGITERGIEVSTNGSIVGEVIASGKPLIARDLQSRTGTHKKIDAETGFVTREIICVPIRSKHSGEIAGAIEVLNKKGDGGFNEEDQALLEDVGEHLQTVVDSIFLGQEAVGMTKNMLAAAIKAIYVAFIAVGVSLFLAVFLSVYGGLPFAFA
ncbi:MAG: GAF domain-containing protein [Betaproteobacteria bacterium]|nr:GAF domain-containing protein [Betaproteobacteria bacterium]